MKIPNPCRIGWWNIDPLNGYPPFIHRGFYLGDLPPSICGEVYVTDLEEGKIIFRVNVLYRPDLYDIRRQLPGTLRNLLEVVLCLHPSSDRAALQAMWEYDLFRKEPPSGYGPRGILQRVG